MSSDIKPGQVRRWNNVPDKSIVIDSVDGVKVRYHQEDGASFTTNAIHLGYGTTLYGWDVTPTDDATPAPLDPSKVRVGDTVTLEGKHGTTIRGPVENVEHDRAEAVIGFSLPGLGWRYLRDGVVAQQDTGVWTLTEHQPAPEPEPALPTTVGSVVLVRGMGGNRIALQLRPDTRRRAAWLHALGNPWVAPIVRDHLIEVLFDAGEVTS